MWRRAASTPDATAGSMIMLARWTTPAPNPFLYSPNPYSLLPFRLIPIPYSLFHITYSLFFIFSPLFSAQCFLSNVPCDV